MKFSDLKDIIKVESAKNGNFQDASDSLQKIIFSLDKTDFISLITEIGTIPEDIEHDSTEEKLYTKVSDIILAKCFMELGLKSEVIRERANCADIIARSQYHNYSLVADAKAFRLSRTAKNQKDFKVECMINWRGDHDYSVLCCPYFQYPKCRSQIYGQAIQGNVLLFSWEYFSILLKNNVMETESFNLGKIWNYSSYLAKSVTVENMEICFFDLQNDYIKSFFNLTENEFLNEFEKYKENIILRGESEIKFWQDKIEIINSYTRSQAIEELIKSLKLNQKIVSINTYINKLRNNCGIR